MGIRYHFESFTVFNRTLAVDGWLFGQAERIEQFSIEHPASGRSVCIACALPSPDVEQAHGPAAACARFQYLGESPFSPDETHTLELRVPCRAGLHAIQGFLRQSLSNEPVHRIFGSFLEKVRALDEGCVLEIGARARSGVSRRALFPPLNYIGTDICAGPNVDRVVDAHALSSAVPCASVDAVLCFSVFEHLLMPWKVAIEFNRVLKPGGWGFVMTHQSFPVHDAPCDYWRFSSQSWKSLFNPHTGFAIVDCAMSDPAYLVPKIAFPDRLVSATPDNFLQSAVLFRKTADTRLSWDVPLREVDDEPYPA